MEDCIVSKFNGVYSGGDDPHYLNELRIHVHNGTKQGGSHDIKIGFSSSTMVKAIGNHTFRVDDGETDFAEWISSDTNPHIINAENADYDIVVIERRNINIFRTVQSHAVCWGFDLRQLQNIPMLNELTIEDSQYLTGRIECLPIMKGPIRFRRCQGVTWNLHDTKDIQHTGLIALDLYFNTNSTIVGTLDDIKDMALLSNDYFGQYNSLYGTNSFQGCQGITGDLEDFASKLAAVGRTKDFKGYFADSGITLPSGITNYAIIKFGSQYTGGYVIGTS